MNDLLRALIQNVVDSTYSTGGVPITAIDRLANYLAANPPGTKDPIVVILSEGAVQDVQILYEGYTVEVRDYDAVDNWRKFANPDESGPLEGWTEIDEDGDRYTVKIWQI